LALTLFVPLVGRADDERAPPLQITAEPPPAEEVDGFIEAQRAWLNIPAVSVAVVDRGRIVKAAGYGVASLELNVPASAATAYRLGSTTKQFIAAAIVLLHQDGIIGLDDRLSKYLTDIPDAWAGMTIRHLLTHTSGLPREAPGFDPFRAQADHVVITSAYAVPLEFPPGDRFSYSNTGYYCLAEVITRTTGRPWPDILTTRLFGPAAMTGTHVSALGVIPGRATGYMPANGAIRNAETWLALRPSGAVVSTAVDLARWELVLRGDAILSAASKREMWTPGILNSGATHGYGFGWFLDEVAGHPRIRHDGGVPGFGSEIQRYPNDELTVIVLANMGNRNLREFALGVASRYRPALSPPAAPAITDASPDVTASLRGLIESFAEARFDRTAFSPDLADRLEPTIRSGFGATLARLGPPLRVELLESHPDGDRRRFRHRVAYRFLTLFVSSTLDADGRIVELAIVD
jgi:CubicO group peptidase (beta-lactamase class C family)